MRHVALVTTSYPDGSMGSEAAGSFVADFAHELSRHTKVTVVTAGKTETRCLDNPQLTIVRFAVPNLPLSLLNPLRPLNWGAIVRTLKAGRTALERVVKSDRPDHLLAFWALPSGHWADQINRRHGIPFSIWALGSDIWNLSRVPIVSARLRTVLQRAENLYADGIELAADVKALCGLECQFLPSTRVLPATNDGPRADCPPYKLAFLGRWHANKGIDMLFEALAGLDDTDWAGISEIRINGGGPMADAVTEAARNLKDCNRPVVVGGFLDKNRAAQLIAWADYLLLPSRIESIPIVFSDAAQLGTPIIATPVGDLPHLYDKYNFGVLSSEVTSSAFRSAIRTALKSSAHSFQLRLGPIRTRFDLSNSASRFLGDISIAHHE